MKKKVIGSLAIALFIIVITILGYIYSNNTNSNPDKNEDVFVENNVQQTNNKDKIKESGNITVYINGDVKNPGVYELPSSSRIGDLVKASGGFNKDADIYSLNLAKKLKDEDYILVNNKNNADNKVNLNAVKGNSTDNDKININTASIEQLDSIPGIGKITAQKIIDYREKNGGFNNIEDLKNIDRIGDKTIEKIKDNIDVR